MEHWAVILNGAVGRFEMVPKCQSQIQHRNQRAVGILASVTKYSECMVNQ